MLGIGSAVFIGALIAIAIIAVQVLLAIWVYRDAESKDMIGWLWVAIVLLVPSYIGLIVFLIVRVDNKKVTCSNCNMKVNGRTKYCSNCGVELVPVIEVAEDEEKFKKSQKNILIGFFSTLGGVVILAILMIACIVSGMIKITHDAIKWMGDVSDNLPVIEETLGDLDSLLESNIANVSVDGEEVKITDEDGNILIYVDGNGEKVEVNLKDIKALLEDHNIEINDEELNEEELENEIRNAIQESLDNLEE